MRRLRKKIQTLEESLTSRPNPVERAVPQVHRFNPPTKIPKRSRLRQARINRAQADKKEEYQVEDDRVSTQSENRSRAKNPIRKRRIRGERIPEIHKVHIQKKQYVVENEDDVLDTKMEVENSTSCSGLPITWEEEIFLCQYITYTVPVPKCVRNKNQRYAFPADNPDEEKKMQFDDCEDIATTTPDKKDMYPEDTKMKTFTNKSKRSRLSKSLRNNPIPPLPDKGY